MARNGDAAHPAMPRTPDEIAAAACVAAGADLLHLHAFDDDGVETPAEGPVTAAIRAVRGVGVEACVLTVADAELLVRRGVVHRFRRVVVEPMESDPAQACAHAIAMEQVLRAAGIGIEQLHHGMGRRPGRCFGRPPPGGTASAPGSRTSGRCRTVWRPGERRSSGPRWRSSGRATLSRRPHRGR
ncbi:3-keto-5-aminohexanoate cleavage protein [Pseudonocardia sp. NPDC046786]|uniref:3-keto-5-aminohexanoate cleavage protein n=1 Tax=Pseudonocardia sp. NPDC046786 TaxID=3155471 RepID=UPI0033D14A22